MTAAVTRMHEAKAASDAKRHAIEDRMIAEWREWSRENASRYEDFLTNPCEVTERAYRDHKMPPMPSKAAWDRSTLVVLDETVS